jgi:hypothetical protein
MTQEEHDFSIDQVIAELSGTRSNALCFLRDSLMRARELMDEGDTPAWLSPTDLSIGELSDAIGCAPSAVYLISKAGRWKLLIPIGPLGPEAVLISPTLFADLTQIAPAER